MKIAFGYQMGVGKDTAVKYLVEKYGGKRLSFANPLYDILYYAQKRCGFTREKDRKFLQFIGTEWGREKDKEVWVRLALEATTVDDGNTFLSDLRFPNEFSALKENGWTCVKLVRNVDQTVRTGSGSSQHLSEIALNNTPNEEWDHIIENNGTLEEFYQKLDKMVNKYL